MGLHNDCFFCPRFWINSMRRSEGQGWFSLEARQAHANLRKRVAETAHHTGTRSAKRMANWLRMRGQFWMGMVHFLVMFMVAR